MSNVKNHSESKTVGQERQLVSEDGPKKSHEVEETLSYKQNQESSNHRNRNSQNTEDGRITHAYECRTPTKLEMELEQEERQQNLNLQAGIEYLEKYGHGYGSKIEIENDKDNCTWGEDLTPSPRKGKNSESLKDRQNKYQGYCYEFQKKNGPCMRKGCTLIHFDPERAYPTSTGRHNNQKIYRDNQTPRSRPSPRHKTNNLNRNTRSSNHNGQKPSQRYKNYNVCYWFQNTGSCPYRSRCKFMHSHQYKHNVCYQHNQHKSIR